jgi:opine dehydrogenase
MSKPTIAVLGAASAGLALAAHFASRGGMVSVIDTEPQSNETGAKGTEREIIVTGAADFITGIEYIPCDYAKITESDIVVVTVPPSQYEKLFDLLIPRLRTGHHIVFFPGSFGGAVLKNKISAATGPANVTISEASSLPFICDGTDRVYIHQYKKELKLSTEPASASGSAVGALNEYLNIFVPGENLLETSLDNINSVLHPLPILMNLGAVEKQGREFRHFIDGVSPLISGVMGKIDAERLAVGKAFGIDLAPALLQLKQYYGDNDSTSFYGYVNSPESPYREIKGYGVNSRYIIEDIPYLLVPTSELGIAAGIGTPVFDACINLAAALTGTDFRKRGFNRDKLRISQEGQQYESRRKNQ